MKLKFGIIGFGKIGRLRKRIIEELNLGEVVAISDPNTKKEDIEKDIFLTKDYNELLKKNIDCVVIATPNNITSKAVIDSLKANKHIFCEKPPGRNLKEVLDIKEAFDQTKNIKLKFGFNHRCHYSVMEAKRIMNSRQMGKLMWARGFYGKSGGINFEKEWRSSSNIAGGGILLDQGIHMIDLLNYFMGDFNEIKSYVDKIYWDIPLEDNAFALLRNNKKQYAILHSSSTQWRHLFRLELFFTEGYMILSGLLTGSRSYGKETLLIAKRQFENELELVGNPMEEEIYFDDDRSWYFEMEDFYKSILENKDIEQGSIYNAVEAMDVVERIYNLDSTWNKTFN